jgi:preprotein translocase subunit SecG
MAPVRHVLTRLLPLTMILTLAMAQVAQAENDGRGLYGATNDKVVTNAGFLLIIFFPVFVILMSTLQRYLEKRKEERKAAQKALGDVQWRGGW